MVDWCFSLISRESYKKVGEVVTVYNWIIDWLTGVLVLPPEKATRKKVKLSQSTTGS